MTFPADHPTVANEVTERGDRPTDVAVGLDDGRPVVRLGRRVSEPASTVRWSLIGALGGSDVAAVWTRWDVEDLGSESFVALTVCLHDEDLDAAAVLGAHYQQRFERTVGHDLSEPGPDSRLAAAYLAAFEAAVADAD